MGKAFLGNLAYNQGQEFNVTISDASFDELNKFNNWAEENGGTTYNGLGTNIKNSFIVCAPQQETNYELITYTTTVSYIDTNGNRIQDEDDISINNGSDGTSTSEKIGTLDTGQYDLLVTDHLGNLIRLTPPFTDIDTKYFSLKNPDLSKSSAEDTNTLYNTRALTFNEDYVKLLGNTNTVLNTLSSTYTPILDTKNEYDATGKIEHQYITLAYTYTPDPIKYPNVQYHGTLSYDAGTYGTGYDYTKDETLKDYNTTYYQFQDYVVSWQSLLERCIKLEQEIIQMKSTDGIIGQIDSRLAEMESRNYIWNGKTSDVKSPTYLWSGNAEEYSKFIADKTPASVSNYIFIHQTKQ